MALDDSLSDALKIRANDLIRPSHWPNIDLIGAQLNLYWAEFQIPVWRMASRVSSRIMLSRTNEIAWPFNGSDTLA